MELAQKMRENYLYLTDLINHYPELAPCRNDISSAYLQMEHCYESKKKMLIAGNGGSAADADHIVAELMKSFSISRTTDSELQQALIEIDPVRGFYLAQNLEMALPAISLTAHNALFTAFSNDVSTDGVFAQQVLGYGRKGDVFWGISTSGNSENILNAVVVAKALGMTVIALTGKNGGILAKMSDVSIQVPSSEPF